MKSLISILLLLPAAALAEGTEEQVEMPDLAADALAEEAGSANRVRGLELSRAVPRRNGSKTMCATTNAYNRSGNFIGLTYWEFTFNGDGTELDSMRDVTGLNSACYSARYKKY
ncbi:hypothetical protein [Sedimentitalea todarodis]|uniref:Uncharacterized protein n=1 Tax=Sedimentitalea todarodis TaxID=1631240 RepID=A0ABU3V903_9RHOB|nr:hypothetical protein [Sedimentitalea todarodis]MDU9002578.1 hypothetical protein [Sedimentitalea todarodis]